jgi:hypothetical protein
MFSFKTVSKVVSSPPNAFTFMAHGGDSAITDKRMVVPEGYKFVTLAVCGNMVLLDELQDALAELGKFDNEVLENPDIHYKKIERAIGKEIHIYTPGMKLPDLSFSFPLTFPEFEGEFRYLPSGIFRLPYNYQLRSIPKRISSEEEAPQFIENLYFSDENLLYDKFMSRFPEKVIDNLKKKAIEFGSGRMIDSLKTYYTIYDLLKQNLLPKGTYYHLICREFNRGIPREATRNSILTSARNYSANQQGEIRNPMMTGFKKFIGISKTRKGGRRRVVKGKHAKRMTRKKN